MTQKSKETVTQKYSFKRDLIAWKLHALKIVSAKLLHIITLSLTLTKLFQNKHRQRLTLKIICYPFFFSSELNSRSFPVTTSIKFCIFISFKIYRVLLFKLVAYCITSVFKITTWCLQVFLHFLILFERTLEWVRDMEDHRLKFFHLYQISQGTYDTWVDLLALLWRSKVSPILHEEMKLEDTYEETQQLTGGYRLRTRRSSTSLHCVKGAIKIPAGLRKDFPDPAVMAVMRQLAEKPATRINAWTREANWAHLSLERWCFQAPRVLGRAAEPWVHLHSRMQRMAWQFCLHGVALVWKLGLVLPTQIMLLLTKNVCMKFVCFRATGSRDAKKR